MAIVALVAVAFVVWIGGLALASAGLALDHPLCVDAQLDCRSSWSWSPPGKRYEWVELDGIAGSGIEPWASQRTDSWAWTVFVLTGVLVGAAAVLLRGRPSVLTRRRRRR